jgi:hypothetical protein
MEPKFPHVEVNLTGQDGNAFAIIGNVQTAMQKAGVDQKDIAVFRDEAQTGDYDHLLQTAMRTVTVN